MPDKSEKLISLSSKTKIQKLVIWCWFFFFVFNFLSVLSGKQDVKELKAVCTEANSLLSFNFLKFQKCRNSVQIRSTGKNSVSGVFHSSYKQKRNFCSHCIFFS